MSKSIRINRLRIIGLSLVLLTYICLTCSADAHGPGSPDACIKPNADPVTLSGKLIKRNYKVANNKIEKVYVLRLNDKICTNGDEIGGPYNGVKEVQVVITDSSNERLSVYQNRRINITGTIFHQISAHHHTQVLLEVTSRNGKNPPISFSQVRHSLKDKTPADDKSNNKL
ncbi:MAG: DUF4431 domain-containing protein [Deltaproteobacteria bacterium]|nr:DUF4431 domain-containing protein [Deltaproteobacteria bacterium]